MNRVRMGFPRGAGMTQPLARRTLREEGSASARRLAEVMDGLAMPILVLAGTGRLMHANAPGRALLLAGRGVCLKSGRLQPREPRCLPRFERALARLAHGGPAEAPVTIPLGDGQPAGRMLGVLRGLRRAVGEPLHPVALHVQDPDGLPPPPLQAFATLHGITPAERRVLERLVAGERLVEAAQRLGIGEATARTHLRSLFSKTGAARQPALVQLVMASSPLVALQGPGDA